MCAPKNLMLRGICLCCLCGNYTIASCGKRTCLLLSRVQRFWSFCGCSRFASVPLTRRCCNRTVHAVRSRLRNRKPCCTIFTCLTVPGRFRSPCPEQQTSSKNGEHRRKKPPSRRFSGRATHTHILTRPTVNHKRP